MVDSLKHYFGIDFGTTNSAMVSYAVIDRKPVKFQYGDSEGRPVPSVIAINKDSGEIITGREAWEKKTELTKSCEYISSIKTIIDDVNWVRTIAGKTWTPVDVACEIFKALKEKTDDIILESATVAIPIGFSASKREKLRTAAKMAGIEIKSFISEPTAAFFANYNELKGASTVAIFDWGGGTLDISVLRNANGRISELATTGMNVAGDYLDKKIAQRLHAKIARKKGVEVAFQDMPHSAQDLLLVRSERAKRALGDDDTTTISIYDYGVYGSCLEMLDYDWFSEIVNPEIDQAIACLDKAITESGEGYANIDRIVMVGGSSNLRPLLEKMNTRFGDKLYFPEETMWNVGQGAAQLSVTPGAYYSNQSVGIVLSDGGYFELLGPDTVLKGWHTDVDFGIVDTSQEARFIFGGSPDIDSSAERFKSLSLPAYRFLQEKINLRAIVDQDMVFRVMAKSNMQPTDYSRFWDYTQLKCYYQLPETRVE